MIIYRYMPGPHGCKGTIKEGWDCYIDGVLLKALQTYRVWLLQPCLVARYVLETLAENGAHLLSVQLSRKPKRLVPLKEGSGNAGKAHC